MPAFSLIVSPGGHARLVPAHDAEHIPIIGTLTATTPAEAWARLCAANPLSQSATTLLGIDPETHHVHPDAIGRLNVPAEVPAGPTKKPAAKKTAHPAKKRK